MKRHNLTETLVERAKLPAAGETFYRDREIRGLALRINFGGTKSFILEGRVRGRVRRITLGRWPVMGVVAARKKALEYKSTIAAGGDPTVETDTEQDATFKILAERYLAYVQSHGKKTWKEDQRMLGSHFGTWYGRRLSDVTRNDVVQIHEEIGREHGKYAANRAVALLRTMLNCSKDWGLLTSDNPAARIKLFKEEKRERFLSPDELHRVNKALMQEPDWRWRAFFPLSLLLGSRRGELLSARWSDIDLQGRTWLKPTTKSGRSHLLPLPMAASAILETLPSRGKSDWLFPSVGKSGHLAEAKSAWARIRTRAGVDDIRIHDLRRTLGSWLAGSGFSLPMIGKALGHSSPSATAIYARLDVNPVRIMLEANAALMFPTTDDAPPSIPPSPKINN